MKKSCSEASATLNPTRYTINKLCYPEGVFKDGVTARFQGFAQTGGFVLAGSYCTATNNMRSTQRAAVRAVKVYTHRSRRDSPRENFELAPIATAPAPSFRAVSPPSWSRDWGSAALTRHRRNGTCIANGSGSGLDRFFYASNETL